MSVSVNECLAVDENRHQQHDDITEHPEFDTINNHQQKDIQQNGNNQSLSDVPFDKLHHHHHGHNPHDYHFHLNHQTHTPAPQDVAYRQTHSTIPFYTAYSPPPHQLHQHHYHQHHHQHQHQNQQDGILHNSASPSHSPQSHLHHQEQEEEQQALLPPTNEENIHNMIPHHFHQPSQVHRFYEYDQGYNQHQAFDQTQDIDIHVPETHVPPDHERIEQNDFTNINHQQNQINTTSTRQTVNREEYGVLDNHSNCTPYDPTIGNQNEGQIGGMLLQEEMKNMHEKDKQRKRTKITAEQAWNNKFEELRAFHAENGHSDVPQTYKKNKSLGKWVGKQREHYKTYLQIKKLTELSLSQIKDVERRSTITETGKKKKSCPLTQDRISKLCSLEFKFAIGKGQYSVFHGTFTSSDTLIQAWEDKFKMLERYKRLYGNLDIPTRPLIESHCIAVENYTVNKIENGLSRAANDNDNSQSLSTMKIIPEANANAPLTENEIKSLGRWLTAQRRKYKDMKKDIVVSSQVLNDRFRRLSELGVNLESNRATGKHMQATGSMIRDEENSNSSIHGNTTRYNSLWETRYKELKNFKEEKGHIEVRANENKTLYDWIHRQRSLFRDYMQGNTKNRLSMTNERIAQLERVGFDWKYSFEVVDRQAIKAAVANATVGIQKRKRMKKSNEEELENVDILTKLQSTVNSSHIKETCCNNTSDDRKRSMPNEESFSKLGFTETMICNSDSLASKVSDDCIVDETEIVSPIMNDLFSGQKSIGLHKRGTKPQLWGQSYGELVKFHSINGHCRVPGKYRLNPKLGYWVKLQREDYKHLKEGKPSPMNDYRINLLEKIGFQFRVVPYSERQNAWNSKFDELKAYRSIHGNCDVPQAYKTNPTLGKWVSKQRDAYRDFHSGKQSRITREKISKLENIGFRFFIGKGKAIRQWNQYFSDVVTFKEKFGHTNIPLCYSADPQLGRWAYFQRVNYMKKIEGKGLPTIVKDRLDQLKSIGFSFHFEKSRCLKRRKRSHDDGILKDEL